MTTIANETIIEPDVAEAVDNVSSAWRQGVESIIETGRRLIEIRERFKDDRGKWSRLIGDNEHKGHSILPFWGETRLSIDRNSARLTFTDTCVSNAIRFLHPERAHASFRRTLH